ncbi:MAG: lipid carrier protein, partial [Ferrovum sp.]|nr:lipid carrier protein [Ferrovum sp.]
MDAPISPVLLLGLVLDKLPVQLVQPVLDGLLRAVLHWHPDCLDRMEEWSQARVLIDPIDLPIAILLLPNPARPSLQVIRKEKAIEVDAIVRGSLETLVALAEGQADGDTLFFSRELIIEGDTEVVLALRNAIDAAAIDLVEDIAKALGPLGYPFRAAAGTGSKVAGQLRKDMEKVGAAVMAPALRRSDSQAFRIEKLEEEVRLLRRQRVRSSRHSETAHE